MDDGSAIERLEQRVAHLEAIVRQLVNQAGLATSVERNPPPKPAGVERPPEGTPETATPRQRRVPQPRFGDWEQWVGQRGLLIVGVLALLATGGFLLKYAFDRGWILPWVRVAGAIVIGAGVMVGGDRFVGRGLRRYGAALIGAGGGLAYLGCWAAAGPYGLVGRGVALSLLLVVAAAVAWLAVQENIEGLCVWALAGAYLAPAFLPHEGPAPLALYLYLAIVAAGAGLVSYRLRWRLAFDTTLAGYLMLPSMYFSGIIQPVPHIAFVTAGGLAGLLATTTRRWGEARLAALWLPWLAITATWSSGSGEAVRWTALAAGAALMLTVWWYERRVDPLAGVAQGELKDPAEGVVFATAPLLLIAWEGVGRPTSLAQWGGAIPAAAAALYLASGWRARLHYFVGMGLGLLALAVAGQWDGVPVVIGWAALSVGCVAIDRWLAQRSGRGIAAALAIGAWINLFTGTWSARPPAEVAFLSSWDVGWYGLLVGVVLVARWWPQREPERGALRHALPGLWALAGLTLFLGGTRELQRLFVGGGGAGSELGANLSISAFWLVYAAALVAAGFRLGRRPVRVGGLALAGTAALKVAFYDLATLEALYRVASFFILALIALGVAYAYNRPGAGTGDAPPLQSQERRRDPGQG
jgi:uncharacterized membrane protein